MERTKAVDRADILIEALPYIQRFRGKTFVIKYGGSVMDNEQRVDQLLRDVVFLEAVGINPVLVHGGGRAISTRLREAGVEARFVAGQRVTDESTIGIVEEILEREINPRIVKKIGEFGGRATGVSGREIFTARKYGDAGQERAALDIGFVGEVTAVNAAPVQRAVNEEVVPVVSPLSHGEGGEILNTNADLAASALAAELKAAKLLYISDVLGLMRDPEDPESLIPTVNRKIVERLRRDEIIAGGMIPKVESALQSIESGVGKVHFIDGRVPHALLLEIFTTSGIGTEVVGQ